MRFHSLQAQTFIACLGYGTSVLQYISHLLDIGCKDEAWLHVMRPCQVGSKARVLIDNVPVIGDDYVHPFTYFYRHYKFGCPEIIIISASTYYYDVSLQMCHEIL